MLYSMTGYGKAKGVLSDKTVIVEVKSLNSRYLDLNVRTPQLYREKEIALRRYLSKKLHRGKVDVTFTIEDNSGVQNYSINKEGVKFYYQQLETISEELGASQNDLMTMVMRIPDVLVAEKGEVSEMEWAEVLKIVNNALVVFSQYRSTEGAALERDLQERTVVINKNLEIIEAMLPQRMQDIRDKILKTLAELLGNEGYDQSRFEQELLYYLEKLDINEESVRLKTHCAYFQKVIQEKKILKGKKLNFIAQEMGREINTIGSKANSAEIQALVVVMKDELEKIKEQLMNVV